MSAHSIWLLEKLRGTRIELALTKPAFGFYQFVRPG
jgi:hypothetical protein